MTGERQVLGDRIERRDGQIEPPPLLFEGGTPSGVDITKEASGAFLVSGMTNEMLYDHRRREIVPLSGFMKVSKVLIIKTMVERR